MGLEKILVFGIEFLLKLDKFENKEFNIIIGETGNIEELNKIKEKYNDDDIINNELENTKLKWKDILETVPRSWVLA